MTTSKISKEERVKLLELMEKADKDDIKLLKENISDQITNSPEFKALVENTIKSELENIGLLRFIRTTIRNEIRKIKGNNQ